MSTEHVEALLERIGSDEDFRAALDAADSLQAKQELVAGAGFDIDRSDLDYLRERAGREGDMSDEEFDKIAGGVAVNPDGMFGGLTPPQYQAPVIPVGAAAAALAYIISQDRPPA